MLCPSLAVNSCARPKYMIRVILEFDGFFCNFTNKYLKI